MNINMSDSTKVSSVKLFFIGCRYEFRAHFRNSTEDKQQYKSIFYAPSIKRDK